jgi:hypothetical protein
MRLYWFHKKLLLKELVGIQIWPQMEANKVPKCCQLLQGQTEIIFFDNVIHLFFPKIP